MSGRTAIRVFAEALLAGEKIDLSSTDVLKIRPLVNDSGALHIGGESSSVNFKVFLGNANTFFEVNRTDKDFALNNVTFDHNQATFTATTINTTDLTVDGTFCPTSFVANTITATNGFANTLVVTTFSPMPDPIVAVNTTAVDVTTTDCGAGAVAINSFDITGQLNSQTILAIPAVDDTGTVTIGSATKGIDFRVNIGQVGKYFEINRGDSAIHISGILIDTNAAINGSGSIINNGNTTITGTATANQSSTVNGSLSVESCSVLPAADDGTACVVGNATLRMPVTWTSKTNTVTWNNDTDKLVIRGIPVDTNAAITCNANITTTTQINATTLNSTATNISGVETYTGNGYWKHKNINLTTSTVIAAAQYTGFIRNNGAAGAITHTLPDPAAGNQGVTLDFMVQTASNITIQSTSNYKVLVKESLKCATFNGSNDVLQINSAAVGAYPFTLGCWFKTTTNHTGVIMRVQDKDSSHGTALQYLGSADAIRAASVAAATGVAAKAGSWRTGAWHLGIATFAAANDRKIYGDGSASPGTNTTTVTISNAYDRTAIGAARGSTPGNYFNGEVDAAFVFSIALNATQIDWLYNSGAGRDYFEIVNGTDGDNPGVANLEAYWQLNEASGETRRDQTGNNYNLLDINGVAGATGKVVEQVVVNSVTIGTFGEHIEVTSDGTYWVILAYDGTSVTVNY